jgi:hypothetical protein
VPSSKTVHNPDAYLIMQPCDTPKKKELVGNYRNAGSDWRPKGDPKRAKVQEPVLFVAGSRNRLSMRFKIPVLGYDLKTM